MAKASAGVAHPSTLISPVGMWTVTLLLSRALVMDNPLRIRNLPPATRRAAPQRLEETPSRTHLEAPLLPVMSAGAHPYRTLSTSIAASAPRSQTLLARPVRCSWVVKLQPHISLPC